ncbi:hypothetical protein F52700_5221 [Fusarium sp. NRRL 52700]|nr:hypothetical protein F52700_5221 [Fusarium sp. NRRL 52700]
MAEAFGIAGSAFGTVSLGLQLFKEISQYLDDIDGREEDLKDARSYATNIQLSLDALDVAISNAPTGDPMTKNAIDSCKTSCLSAVNNLLAVVKDLRGPIMSAPNSNVNRAKECVAKLKYPFKKQNLEKFEENLWRTNNALQTILQIIQLNTGQTTTSALHNMHQAVADLNALSKKSTRTLDEMHKTSQLHDGRLSALQQDVRELLILTRDSEDAKLLLKTTAQQVSALTSGTAVATNLLQNPESKTFIPSIQTTSYQGGGGMTFNAFCSCKTQRVRYTQRHWGPFLVEAEVRSRDHHAPECPMSKLQSITRRTKRVFSLLIPTSQSLWGRASRISLSFTTGVSMLGFGQTVAWIATVDESLSPVFRLVETISRYVYLPRKEMHMLLSSCFRRLIWCYANSRASVTDVDQRGDTVLGWALRQYLASGERIDADNIAELFQMLTIIAEPTSCTRKITAIPIPVLIAASEWFRACSKPDRVATSILSKCSEPTGHHHKWNLSWRENENGLVSGYRIFQAFPQVVENLEIGPLSLAIIKQDRNEVQQLLERCPSYIKESNYCGQSPLHLAIETQNVAVISIVLQYADSKALHAKDNEGLYPIDYVTKTTWNPTKEPQRNCEGQGSSTKMQHSIYEEDIGTLYDHQSIYSFITDGKVAEYAYQLGFHYSDKEFADFIRSLALHLSVDNGYEIAKLFSAYRVKINDFRWIYAAIIRYYTFVSLDLRHACCSIIGKASGPLSDEEIYEIEEEDYFLLELFESLLTEFEDGRPLDMILEEFFKWMWEDWAPRMREVKKELASQRLTDEQLRDAESIGVVWEAYGPQPMEQKPAWLSWGNGDLWDAMDELDQIATDPERPMKGIPETHT